MTELSPIAEEILKERYYDQDSEGNILEDWEGLSRRVAKAIAKQELRYLNDPQPHEEDFFEVIYNLDFVPNTPTLMNAGSIGGLGLLSACFVQVPDDSLDSIMEHGWHSAKLFQSGAGVGYNFSNLRGPNEMVKTSMRNSSGAVSFMKHIFNSIGEVVKQGGRRRAAMMGLLDANHPEIENFIAFKNEEKSLENFNISIMADDDFMRAIERNLPWTLKNRTNGNIYKTVSAKNLLNQVAVNNHKMAEPGMIFKDNINKYNPLRKTVGDINCVNPCGEATLYNYENCCLGSINLVNHISNGQIDWIKLERTIRIATRFLDDVVDANVHVNDKFRDASLSTRRIGLGITGFADALVMLNSRYGSEHSLDIARSVARFMNSISVSESKKLAQEKGPYPLWQGSWHEANGLMLRNVSGLAIAPEGTRSLITSTSPSIEPNFGREITRTKKGIGSGTWLHPLAVNENFVTTYEVSLSEHINMQAAWQDELNANMFAQSISKTNNAPTTISEDEMGEAYLEAWRLGCKGITMYRDGSRDAVYYEKKDNELRDESGHIIDECATGACDVGMMKVEAMVK